MGGSRQGYVFCRGEVVDEIIGLEHEGHMISPVPGQAVLGNVLPVEQDLPLGGAVQAAQQREQGGFSTPRGS